MPSGIIIPHVRMHERDFVLIPMSDIAENWIHPVFAKTTAELLSEIDSAGIVRILSEI